jgi:tRNA threonylcarbamoyladenosine biosynthesis protein TsaB
MNILAIETSGSSGTVALRHGADNLQVNITVQQQQIACILELIDELLQRCQLQIQDLDYLAFSAGPGSFTGIRIAFGVIQGIALATNKPVLAISSLQTLAQTSWRLLQQTRVIPVMNAYMDQVYWGCYQVDMQGIMQPFQPDQVSAPDVVTVPANESYFGIGNAWQVYAEQIPPAAHQALIQCDTTITPQAYDLLTLAQVAAQEGAAKPIDDIAPYYLRDKTAWRKIATK